MIMATMMRVMRDRKEGTCCYGNIVEECMINAVWYTYAWKKHSGQNLTQSEAGLFIALCCVINIIFSHYSLFIAACCDLKRSVFMNGIVNF